MTFEIKTEAPIITHSSGMTREDKSDKIRFDLIPEWFLWRLAELYTKGAKNHAPRNWEKASTPEDLDLFIQAEWRHFMKHRRGDTDEDHLAALVFNLIGEEHVKAKLKK